MRRESFPETTPPPVEPGERSAAAGRDAGWTLLDSVLGLALVGTILLGVLASLSAAFDGARTSDERLESQMLLSRVVEEIQASPFDTLLSFNGTFVEEDGQRADISVVQLQANLVEIQVDVSSANVLEVASRGVLLVANPE